MALPMHRTSRRVSVTGSGLACRESAAPSRAAPPRSIAEDSARGGLAWRPVLGFDDVLPGPARRANMAAGPWRATPLLLLAAGCAASAVHQAPEVRLPAPAVRYNPVGLESV